MTGGVGNSDIGINMSFNNVKFYGPSMTGQPTTWKADSVTGSFYNLPGPPPIGFGFTVSGGGMSAYVRATGSDTDFSGTWTATVANGTAPSGVGQYRQPFTFSGTASGTWAANWLGTGSLSGISSGVVPSTLTQDPIVTQAVQVGAIASMSASSGPPYYDFISLYQVKFWGASIGAQPFAWTGKVDGSRSTSSSTTAYNLSGGTPTSTATINLNSMSGGSWTAYVNNGIVPAGGMGAAPNNQAATAFNGRAAGTYTTSGGYNSIVGTASGGAGR